MISRYGRIYVNLCKYYASLYEKLEHPWIWVSKRSSETNPHGYPGMTVWSFPAVPRYANLRKLLNISLYHFHHHRIAKR
jgi:hypothetical protein